MALRSPSLAQTPPLGGTGMNALTAVSRHDDAIAIGPILPEDMAAVFIWLNDVQAAKNDVAHVPVDGVTFKAWIDRNALATSEYLFSIRKLYEAHVIGFVLIKNLSAIHRSAEMGVRIGSEAERGKGYGSRATSLVLDYAFDTLNLHRISLTVFAHNARAIAAYRRVGFRHEGLMRQANFIDGRWVDVAVMSVLRDERGSVSRP